MSPPRPDRRTKPQKRRWHHRTSVRAPRVVVVGFGRLGGALSVSLRDAGVPVSVFPRSDDSVRRAAELGLHLADHDALREAAVCMLAVPDHAVFRVAQSLKDDLGPDTVLVHCAGALDLGAFGDDPATLRRARGSFHPLCAVSDPNDELTGHSVAIAGSPRSVQELLERLAERLGMFPLEIPEARRAAYHAGAVLSAAGVVALASAAAAAVAEAGVDEERALRALLPLMRSAIRGVEQRGLERGLTGPVVRGDLAVVSAHLAALPPELGSLYRSLARRSLELVKGRLPVETRNALAHVLRD